MAEKINDGGPAFPTFENAGDPRQTGFMTRPGMTLRDWFAAAALTGLCANPADETGMSKIAPWCYEVADAMLAAREPKP